MSQATLKNFFTRVDDSETDWYLTLSDHSLTQFCKCPRAGQLYILERRKERKGTAALNAGSVFHKAQEIRARVKDPEQLATLQTQLIEKFFVENPVDEDEFRNAERLTEACKRYNKEYKFDQTKVLTNSEGQPFTEIHFVLPLGKIIVNHLVNIGRGEEVYIGTLYIQWQGLIDQLIVMDTQNFVRDFKTATRGGPTYFDQFPMSQQMRGYVWAVKQLYKGGQISGALVDLTVWRKPTPTGKPFDFDRQRFYFSDEQLEEWQHETMETITSFVMCLRAGVFPMSGMSQGCIFKYGKCPYFNVCSLPKKFRKEILYSDEYQDVQNREENRDE